MNEENIFYVLNYTHNEILNLFKKIEENCVLTPEQYDQLIDEIGLNNISTFTGDYDDLINKPEIPLRVSELFNDVGFITEKDVIYEITDELVPIKEQLNNMDLIVSALNKLDLELVSDDLAYVQDRINYLNKIIEELRNLNNSFSNQLDNTRSSIDALNNDIDLIISEQNYINQDIKNVKENIRTINETKIELIKTTDYLKDTIVGENEYEFEKSIVEVLKETRGEDFSDNTRALDEVSEILETLIGTGDEVDENTFGVLMRQENGIPTLICVRDYLYKIDSIYEQLGKEGLIAFIEQFRTVLDALDKNNEELIRENEELHERINELERLHIQDKEIIDQTLEDYAAAIKTLENSIRNYDVAGLNAKIDRALSTATQALNYADGNNNEIRLLNNRVDSIYSEVDSRLDILEDQPEHIYVTETQYYRDYTEEERNSKDKLFIVTDFTDQDLDWNIERFLTKDLVANNSVTEFVTQAEYDRLMNSQQISNNVIYVITDNTNNPSDTYTSIDTSSVQLAMKNSIFEVDNTSLFVDVDNQLKFKDCDGRIFAIDVTEEK